MAHSVQAAILRIALVIPGSLLLAGCGEQAPYPEAKVTTPVGRASACASCGKKIERVVEDHLVTFQGVRYIVCDEQCTSDLKEWIRHQ